MCQLIGGSLLKEKPRIAINYILVFSGTKFFEAI